ncbi:MAG: riboflavin kinase, partial [Oscillospiraceae bacterium]|nr:riboflavin kinase [Oscillospiraceae bacterium]
ASYIETDGRIYRGITNVGVKPTVTDSSELLCETNIFDFDGDIYGRSVRVTLVCFVRGEMRFSGVDELKARIAEDTAYVRTLDI